MSHDEAVKHVAERVAKWKKAMNGDVDALIELGILYLDQKEDKETDNE